MSKHNYFIIVIIRAIPTAVQCLKLITANDVQLSLLNVTYV